MRKGARVTGDGNYRLFRVDRPKADLTGNPRKVAAEVKQQVDEAHLAMTMTDRAPAGMIRA